MIDDPRELTRVRNSVLLLSAAAWIWLLLDPGGSGMQTHCGAASLQALLAMNPPAVLLAGWSVMLVAMMAPALVLPIAQLRMRSFKRRRPRAVALFIVGYATVW